MDRMAMLHKRKFGVIAMFLILIYTAVVHGLGAVSLSPLHLLKVGRESFTSLFVLGEEDWAYWHLTISSKRITEATIMKEKGHVKLAYKHLEKARIRQLQARALMNELYLKTNIDYLNNFFDQNEARIAALGK